MVDEIDRTREKYQDKVSAKVLTYVNRLEDTSQYPAARCGMSEDIVMYGRSASSGNESMTRANYCARQRIAIDLVNATMVLLKLESGRFNRKKEIAWGSDEILTPKGKEKREEVMKDVHLRDFIIETEENEDHVRCRVKKNSATHMWRTTTFPLEEVNGSRFGTCTCGSPRMMGVPCVHMVVALKSGSVVGLNENNFMPTWWMISQMRLQYPLDMMLKADMDMASLKAEGVPDQHIRYCPPGAAPRKSGRPKGDGRLKGALERNGKKRGR